MAAVIGFLLSYAVTIVVEFLIYLAYIKKYPARLLMLSVLINGLTLSISNIALSFTSIIYIEIGVFIAEIFLIKLLLETSYPKSLAISFTANFLSWILSYIIVLFVI
jgi:hypothetical protein